MPKYMLSVYGPAESNEFGGYASKEEMLQSFQETGAFNEKLAAEGYFVFADGLEPATTATVVDGQGDQPRPWGRPTRGTTPFVLTDRASLVVMI